MGEDDYNELFGVTPEGGGEENPAPGTEQGPEDVPESGTPAQDAGGVRQDEAGSAAEAGAEDASGPDAAEQMGNPQGPGPEGAKAAVDGPGNQPQAAAAAGDAVARAKADAQKAVDEAFALSGMKNPYTGQPITSKAEYDAYREQFAQEQRAELLRRSGMSEAEFSRFVQELPEVRQASRDREELEKAVREAREAAAKVKVDEQLREISAMDPSVKSLADLPKMPTYPQFYELVRRGNTLTDAFRLANFDALAQRAAAGARQAAMNAQRGKEHLTETRTRGAGAVSVPADVREQYKLFNPDVTEEEIQKHYAKFHKEG